MPKFTIAKKNELLFLEGEEVERFYIISDGAMKLAVSDSEGNEAIIRIVNSGSICDIFSDNFSFNCQALADSKILSFPIKKIRNFVKENSDLLYNMLLDSSEKNRELSDQLSVLKLNDGKKRIGHFLLKNSMRAGEKIKNFNLSYTKSQIASYLGIRLETFSRLFRQLKDDEKLLIEKKKIILPKKNSLCKYCSREIAVKCKSRDEDFCEQF